MTKLNTDGYNLINLGDVASQFLPSTVCTFIWTFFKCCLPKQVNLGYLASVMLYVNTGTYPLYELAIKKIHTKEFTRLHGCWLDVLPFTVVTHYPGQDTAHNDCPVTYHLSPKQLNKTSFPSGLIHPINIYYSPF